VVNHRVLKKLKDVISVTILVVALLAAAALMSGFIFCLIEGVPMFVNVGVTLWYIPSAASQTSLEGYFVFIMLVIGFLGLLLTYMAGKSRDPRTALMIIIVGLCLIILSFTSITWLAHQKALILQYR